MGPRFLFIGLPVNNGHDQAITTHYMDNSKTKTKVIS